MTFGQVPVACVEPSWLTGFLRLLEREFGTEECSVFLMPVDSQRESEFLCSQVNKKFSEVFKCRDLKLVAFDPTIGWEQLFGLSLIHISEPTRPY